jgi:hypothetical protein
MSITLSGARAAPVFFLSHFFSPVNATNRAGQ